MQTGNKSHIFRGPTTPVTSLALAPLHPTLYAGSWDKTIWSWDIASRSLRTRFHGHSDFVKCVLILPLPGLELLISGSSDSTIILWNTATGERLRTLKGHSMGVLALAIDSLSGSSEFRGVESSSGTDEDSRITEEGHSEAVTLFSASSDRTILRWHIFPSTSPIATQIDSPLHPHQTSIYALLFSPSSADLYTASADGTAMRLSREHAFTPDTILHHGDYVRSVAVSMNEQYVVTAGRDEDIKVWDANSGKMVGLWWGHSDEVMGLVVVKGKKGERIVSAGIDQTVRVWALDTGDMERARVKREEEKEGTEAEAEVKVVEGGLTAEEEAELAELMDE